MLDLFVTECVPYITAYSYTACRLPDLIKWLVVVEKYCPILFLTYSC